MDLSTFKSTLSDPHPPEGISDFLKALWYDGKDNWNMAHDIAQDHENEFGNWIHAYLHRKEGDDWNAAYWYRRAGRAMPSPSVSLDQEWNNLVSHFLADSTSR